MLKDADGVQTLSDNSDKTATDSDENDKNDDDNGKEDSDHCDSVSVKQTKVDLCSLNGTLCILAPNVSRVSLLQLAYHCLCNYC